MTIVRMSNAWSSHIQMSVIEQCATVFKHTLPQIDDPVIAQEWMDTMYTPEEQLAARRLKDIEPQWLFQNRKLAAAIVVDGKRISCTLTVPFIRPDHTYTTIDLGVTSLLTRHPDIIQIAVRNIADNATVTSLSARILSSSKTIQEAVQRLPMLERHLPRVSQSRIKNPRRFNIRDGKRFPPEPLTELEYAALARLALGATHEPV